MAAPPKLISVTSRAVSPILRRFMGMILVPVILGPVILGPVSRLERRPAAVDDDGLSGDEGRFVRTKIKHEFRHLFGPAEASHGLALDEGLAGGLVIALRAHPVLEGRAIDGART